MGKLYGVGVGPGDPELMTLKAVRIMNECDIIILPDSGRENIAYKIAKPLIQKEKEILYVDMPMTKDPSILEESHKKAANTIIKLLNSGKNLAFLTLGDPSLYSTFAYINYLVKQTNKTEVIPGITSFSSCASLLNDPLVVSNEELHIIPGNYDVNYPGTTVFLKSGKQSNNLIDRLKTKHYNSIKAIENCNMENEHIFNSVKEINRPLSYFTTIIAK